MPIYMDRHELKGQTRQDVAEAHLKDLQVQHRFGVKFLTYWFDEERESGFCLIEADDKGAAVRAHEASHENLPSDIIEVDPATVLAFLGRVQDPEQVMPSGVPGVDAGVRTVMFTDIADSTEMTARLGDHVAMEIVRAHDGLVRNALAHHHGREIKHTGDGIMAVFASPPGAVACARAIQQALAEYNRDSREPLRVRIGMHTGEPVEDSNDLFGATVQLASRLCAAAEPGQIVLSEVVASACPEIDGFSDAGVRRLKGFAEPVRLIACDWQ